MTRSRSARTRLPARLVPALLLTAAATLAGCGDDGPSGPGTLEGRVTSGAASLGAVVLVVDGSGIQSVSGSGDTRVFEGPVQQTSRRVVLVGGDSGELRFELEVDDRADPRPTVTVQSAVDVSNLAVEALSSIDVRISAR